jgi:two-component system, NarL family, invasion response regulator UvrY
MECEMVIVLADDHVVVRRGLRELLASSLDDADFIEVGTADEALRTVLARPCSLVMLDVNMPGRTGVDVLREIKRLCPRLPVLMLSVQPEDQYAVRCLRAGASGYLCKDSSEDEILKAVRKALSGGRYVSAQLSEQLAHEIHQPAGSEPHALLSDREIEVLRLMASGKSLTEIAEVLHVSVKTVSTYRGRCLLKMHMQSNAELIRYVLEHKLLP